MNNIDLIETYFTRIDISNGRVPLKLRKFQKEVIDSTYNKPTMLYHSRQSGGTTTVVSLALSHAVLNPNKTTMILTNKVDSVNEIRKTLLSTFDPMAALQPSIEINTKDKVKYSNGSIIHFNSIKSNCLKGIEVDLLIIDNATFCELDDFLNSIISSLNPKKILFTGCKNENKALDNYIKSNNFNIITVPFYEVEGRDINWFISQLKALGNDYKKMNNEHILA